VTVEHDVNCPHKGRHTDAAKRVSDQYNLHLVAGGADAIGRTFAVALADGRSDGALYDDMGDAVRHQRHNESHYGFLRVNPASMTPCTAQGFLNFVKPSRRRGIGAPDRDHRNGGRVLIPRLTIEDQRAQVLQILTGSAPSNLIQPRN
jgi:hypothetical protein